MFQKPTKLAVLSALAAIGPFNDLVNPQKKSGARESALAILNSGERNVGQIELAIGEIKNEVESILDVAPSERTDDQRNRMNELVNLGQ